MNPTESLRVEVHRCLRVLHPDGIPATAGTVSVTRCWPPVQDSDSEPFYAVVVDGVWRKSRSWSGPELGECLERAEAGVRGLRESEQ